MRCFVVNLRGGGRKDAGGSNRYARCGCRTGGHCHERASRQRRHPPSRARAAPHRRALALGAMGLPGRQWPGLARPLSRHGISRRPSRRFRPEGEGRRLLRRLRPDDRGADPLRRGGAEGSRGWWGAPASTSRPRKVRSKPIAWWWRPAPSITRSFPAWCRAMPGSCRSTRTNTAIPRSCRTARCWSSGRARQAGRSPTSCSGRAGGSLSRSVRTRVRRAPIAGATIAGGWACWANGMWQRPRRAPSTSPFP